jgi:hypothetical protein
VPRGELEVAAKLTTGIEQLALLDEMLKEFPTKKGLPSV